MKYICFSWVLSLWHFNIKPLLDSPLSHKAPSSRFRPIATSTMELIVTKDNDCKALTVARRNSTIVFTDGRRTFLFTFLVFTLMITLL